MRHLKIPSHAVACVSCGRCCRRSRRSPSRIFSRDQPQHAWYKP